MGKIKKSSAKPFRHLRRGPFFAKIHIEYIMIKLLKGDASMIASKHMRYLMLAGVLALVSCGFIAGCANDNGPLLGSPSTLLPDVPLPSGFELDDDHSRMWTDGTLRYADMVYDGRADINAIQKFYTQQMSTCHWIAQSEQFSQGRATLDYVKNSERCRISIYKEGSLGTTYIHVVIWPHRPNAKISPKNR